MTTVDTGRQQFQLSFAQERIWFLEQLHPGTPAFALSTSLRADGPLDVDAVRDALAGLTARHESLRTRFVLTGSGPVQEVQANSVIPLEIIDLRGVGADADERAQVVLRGSHRIAFDLGVAPLMRACIVRTADDRAVLAVGVHHIICDGPSAAVLWRDLTELYRAAVQGTEAALPELSVQYADYAEWQRDTVDDQVSDAQLEFWRQELAGTTGRVDLPTDRPRPAVREHAGALLSGTLPADLASRLLDLARQERVSPFMVMLAAYQLVLARTSGRADFCVGTSIAGRTRPELSDVLGCFLNLLPLRSDLTGDLSVSELLGRVRQRCVHAYGNADIPFEHLVNHLAPARDLSRPPLFEVLLTVQHGRTLGRDIEGVTLTPEPVSVETAHYDLAMDIDIDDGGADLVLCYATSLFDESTARLLLDRFVAALAAFAEDAGQRLSEVVLPGPVVEWSRIEAGTGAVVATPPEADAAPVPSGNGKVGDRGARGTQGPRTHLERALLDGFTRSLARGGLGIHDDFFAAGGTSLTAARLVASLGDAAGTAVPLKLLFQFPTVAGLAAALRDADGAVGASNALERAARDQVLPEEISPSGPARTGPHKRILLTGATGFIGSHLLTELLAAGAERVICLVRGPSPQACAEHLHQRLPRYRLEVEPGRVEVLHGDLTEARLGLDPQRFAALADEVDAVYHSGAHMNFVRPYGALHDPNVAGTREILRLACTGRPSAVHYLSTIDSSAGDVIAEEPIPITTGRDDGYVLTKKTAEHLVLQAGQRGLPIGVYRPWQVTSHSATGAVNPSDQLALCLAGILLARVAPVEIPLPLRILPVDHVARAIVELSRSTDADHPIHHFYNPQSIPVSVVNEVLRDLGYVHREVSFQQWRIEVVRRTANQVDGLAALPLLAPDAAVTALPSHVETANTVRRLGRDPGWPDQDAEWVRRTVRFLVANGTVPAPDGVG